MNLSQNWGRDIILSCSVSKGRSPLVSLVDEYVYIEDLFTNHFAHCFGLWCQSV